MGFRCHGDRPRVPWAGGPMTGVAGRRRRSGFTLVELLVVIAVLAILMVILLPAIATVRSAARRTQCANNLKQLGLAVQSYHGRNESLPSYWGSAKNAPGELFGPWLMHILPDLEEQPFYDKFSEAIFSSGSGGSVTRTADTGTWVVTGTIPGVPASPDYEPGTWTYTVTNVINFVGVSVPVGTWTYSGKGTPAQGPWFEREFVPDGGSVTTTISWYDAMGLHPSFDDVQSLKSLAVLQCGDDGFSVPPGTMVPARGRTDGVLWSLTNYLANAHAFMRFGGGRQFSPPSAISLSGTMGGRFPRAVARITRVGSSTVPFDHLVSQTTSLNPRTFDSITDGLSNTILFGEAMRQCDNGQAFRFAFLPTAVRSDEHSFGIDPSVTEVGSGQWGDVAMGYGNTIMFQQRPPMAGCNKFRIQANHEVLNVAMCDGSVRGISPRVSRREQCDPDVAGREYGRDTYNAQALGGVGTGPGQTQPDPNVSDGIWDNLMMPTDGNVLTNTGEVGKER